MAGRLEAGEAVCLEPDEELIAIDPPGTVEFGVKAEREGPANGPGELSLGFELEEQKRR